MMIIIAKEERAASIESLKMLSDELQQQSLPVKGFGSNNQQLKFTIKSLPCFITTKAL